MCDIIRCLTSLRHSELATHVLTRRRFLFLSSAALAAPGLLPGLAWAAAETWVQNHRATDLWSRSRGGEKVDHVPQWSYFKVLGPQENSRLPVEHPIKKTKVYIESNTVGPSGPPGPDWSFGASRPAQPPPTQPSVVVPPPPGPGPATPSEWVANFVPTKLWSAPDSSGLSLGEADPGSFFKQLEPQRGPRLKVQDAITGGQVYIEAAAVGPVGGPPAVPRVPARWWGFVGSDDVNLRAEPTGDSQRLGTLAQGTPVVVNSWVEGQEVIPDQPGWARLDEGVYVYSPLLRKASIDVPPPPPVHGPLDERWIDVNLTQQTVSAYEHDRPIYLTTTSSGRPGWETREGIHQILWRKEKETMDSNTLLGRDAARARYRIENIRWTQYITSDGQALHENFWRDPELFGIPSSHGCLGLVEQDALWFWLWAEHGIPVSVHY